MIALIGHGYIGKKIAIELHSAKVPFRWVSHNDIHLLQHQTLDWVINAAGFTGTPNVDQCEVKKQECVQGNVVFPFLLTTFVKCPIIHISSGCIYTGYKEGGWLESDPPNFDFNNGSFYSGSKALEQAILELIPYQYILRIRLPFGAFSHPKNYLTKISNYQKLVDFENSLTSIDDLAKVVLAIMEKRPMPTIYNVCNPGSTTTRKVADMMGLKKEWFTHEEFNAAVKAPRSNCVMNTDRICKVYNMRPVEEALQHATKTINMPG